jgi:single-stranded-DNA-specific exonuclease
VFEDTEGGIDNLCAVGLIFKLVHGILKKRRDADDERAHEVKLRDYLDLVAMGPVADLVPLVGENRILAHHGLRALGETKREGLRSLMKVSGMDPLHGPRPVDGSFRLAPRINASGRLADASLSVDLLLSDNPEFCRDAANQLDAFNRERQDIERRITETAFETVGRDLPDAHGIVVFDEEWHSGVVGVVASRLSRHLHKPCIVLGREGRFAKGSGRSIPGVNLIEALDRCRHLLESWGGHPMAVGVSLKPSGVSEFQEAFDQSVRECRADDLAQPSIDIAAWISLDAAHEGTLGDLDLLHPFGQFNPEPVFGTRGVVFEHSPEVFKKHHFRFQLLSASGRRVFGVAWNLGESVPPVGQPVDIAYQLVWNRFNGRSFVQLQLQDWRESE